jgi:hypothetical protein
VKTTPRPASTSTYGAHARLSSALREMVRVALHPSLELRHGNQDQLAGKDHFELWLHLPLEVVDAMPSEPAASFRVSVYRGTGCRGRTLGFGIVTGA